MGFPGPAVAAASPATGLCRLSALPPDLLNQELQGAAQQCVFMPSGGCWRSWSLRTTAPEGLGGLARGGRRVGGTRALQARVPEPRPCARQLWGARGCGWDRERRSRSTGGAWTGQGRAQGTGPRSACVWGEMSTLGGWVRRVFLTPLFNMFLCRWNFRREQGPLQGRLVLPAPNSKLDEQFYNLLQTGISSQPGSSRVASEIVAVFRFEIFETVRWKIPPADHRAERHRLCRPDGALGSRVAGPNSAPALWVETPAWTPLHRSDSASPSWTQAPVAGFLPAKRHLEDLGGHEGS